MRIYSCDKQNFQGVRLKHQSFESFREFALKNNFLENYPKLFCPDNFVNEGYSNRVYRIPDNPDFLLRVRKIPTPERHLGFGPVEDAFPTLNIGQEVARLNEDVTVVVKQQGEPCGIRHFDGKRILPLQPEDKATFLKYLSTIAGFPLKAYEDYIKEVQIVNKVKLVDVHNPQNVLYDTENKCFNIIDVGPKINRRKITSPLVLASQLCDFRHLFQILKMSDPKEQELVLESVSAVAKNVKSASKSNGLKPSIRPYLYKIYNWMKGNRVEDLSRFLEFRSLYVKNN